MLLAVLTVLFLYLLSQFVLGTTQYCLEANYDLCVGFSGNATVARPLQLKRRHSRIIRDEVIIWYEDCQDKPGLCTPGPNGTVYWVDKLRGRIQAGLSRSSAGLVWEDSRLRLLNSSLCLTAVECANGGGDFCNPYSIKAVQRPGQLRDGAYMAMKPCIMANHTLAQTFLLNPPCRKGCPLELLMNLDCDQECNYAECFWDLGQCNSTQSPTGKRFKTKKPTMLPTPEPTLNPTGLPTVGPSLGPTVQPSRGPTWSPTIEPTVGPTVQPTQSPVPGYEYGSRGTVGPTMGPTGNPTQNPTRNPTRNPTQNPTGSLSPVSQPVGPSNTLAPTLPVKPDGASTSSPTGTGPPGGLSEAAFLTLVILLPLIGLILIIFLCWWFLWERLTGSDRLAQHPQTRLPQNPAPLPAGPRDHDSR